MLLFVGQFLCIRSRKIYQNRTNRSSEPSIQVGVRFLVSTGAKQKPRSMRDYCLAGAEGIEPALLVLETSVLPLNDAPKVFNCAESVAENGGRFKPLTSKDRTRDGVRSERLVMEEPATDGVGELQESDAALLAGLAYDGILD